MSRARDAVVAALLLQCAWLVQAAEVEAVGRLVVGLHNAVDGATTGHGGTWDGKEKAPTKNERVAPRLQPVASQGSGERRVNVSDVFWMTLFMAAACGLGALPFFFIDKLSKGWAALANAVACGVMLAASFDLLHEAEGYGSLPLVLGLVFGCMFIKYLQDWLEKYEDVKFEGLSGANAQKILMFVGIMAAHAVGEGSGVGVSFCGRRGWTHGLLVTLAIGLHNIPEGLAVATVLVAKGTPPRKALEWTLLCALPQPIFAVLSYIFVDSFTALLPASMGFAAGCMIWIVIAELLPDALEDLPAGTVASTVTLSATVLEALRVMLSVIERPSGSLAASLSGDSRLILAAVGAASVCVPVATAAAYGTAFAAGAGRATPAPAKVAALLAGSAIGVQATHSLLDASSLLGKSSQQLYVSLALAAGGALLLWGFFRYHKQLLKDSLRRDEARVASKVDLEAAMPDLPTSDSSWDMVSASSRAHSSTPYGLTTNSPPSGWSKGSHSNSNTSNVHQANAASAALMSLLAFAGLAIVQGWRAAEASVRSPTHSLTTLALPLCLWMLPPAVALAGLGPQLTGPGAPRSAVLALVMALVLVATVAFSVLRYPTGIRFPPEIEYDPNHWIDKACAVTAGASLVASVAAFWPVAHRMHSLMAFRGAVAGSLLTIVLTLIRVLLCVSTPFCMASQ